MLLDLPTWLPWALFAISFASIVTIYALSFWAISRSDFQFFPPPSKRSWQHRTFILLFRLFLYPLITLSIVTFERAAESSSLVRYGSGVTLFTVGFGLALWITLKMGWRNAFGEKRGLVTDGWFRFSRNPVYVATWLGLAGWGLIANHLPVTILLLTWAALYMLAPFFEEPWLEAQYGASYRAYKARTRRFV